MKKIVRIGVIQLVHSLEVEMGQNFFLNFLHENDKVLSFTPSEPKKVIRVVQKVCILKNL